MSSDLPAVEAFAFVATEYCVAVGRLASAASADLLPLSVLLARLQLAAMELPGDEAERGAPELATPRGAGAIESGACFAGLPVDYYWSLPDPLSHLYASAPEPVLASLVDTLKDIYLELRQGLELYEAGWPAAAAWKWRFGFWTHWGRHLTMAQSIIFALLSGVGPGAEARRGAGK